MLHRATSEIRWVGLKGVHFHALSPTHLMLAMVHTGHHVAIWHLVLTVVHDRHRLATRHLVLTMVHTGIVWPPGIWC